MEDQLLTIREVAKRLRVDATTVRHWIKQGLIAVVTLPCVGKRRSYRIPMTEFEKIAGQSGEKAYEQAF